MAQAKKQPSGRVEIGFSGGQVASIRLTEKQTSGLRKALDAGDGWFDIETEDGNMSVDLGKVAFLRVLSSDQQIGFSDS